MSVIASLMPVPKLQLFGNDGKPLAGGKIYTAQPGTAVGPGQTYPKATYTDSTAMVANPNPIVLDSAGRANVWITGYYAVAVYDSVGNLLYTIDNVSSVDNSNMPINSAVVVPCTATSQRNNIVLPADGGEFIYIRTDATQYFVTLLPTGNGVTIMGLNSYDLTQQWESVHLIMVGNTWLKI